jgi:hypothetical protein
MPESQPNGWKVLLTGLTWVVMATGLLITGGNLYSSQVTTLGTALMLGSAAVFVWGMVGRNG